MSGSTRPSVRARLWQGPRLKLTSIGAALAVLVAFGIQADQPTRIPVSVSCDDIGYAYDAAGQLVGVQDRANQTARYAYDQVGNATSVTNQGTPDLAVLAVVPSRGAVGDEVTIEGGCFADTPGANTVTFDGVPATVTSASGRRLVVEVPDGADTGLVSVTVAGQTAQSPQPFVVSDAASSAPTVTGVSPTVVVPGQALTVSGTGFATEAANNAVTLNRTRGYVTAAGPGGFSMEVPTGAASGRVEVRTMYGTGRSGADVYVAPAPYAATDVAYAHRTELGVAQTVAIPTAGDIGLLIFDLAEGQRASVTLSAGTFGSCGISTVKVLDPFGRTVASTGCVGATGFVDTVTARTAGTYTLLLPATTSATGSIVATVREVPADPTAETTPGGAAATLTTTVAGQNAAVTFPGTTGQRISVVLSGGTYGTYNATVSLRRPGGTAILSNSSCGASCFFDTTVLPADGTYTVHIDPESTYVGALTAQVYEVPADAAVTATPGGAEVTVTTTVPGQNGVVSFAGTAGQRISAVLSAGTYGTYDATVSLRRPDGTSISSNTSCGASCFFDSTVLPVDGTYTLLVNPEGTQVGTIKARVHVVPADATATVTAGGSAVTVTTTTPGHNSVVSFPGTAGQRISVALSAGTYGTYDATVTLRRPDGTSITSNTSCGASCFFDSTVLPVDGTYTIHVDPEGTVTGAISVRVYDVPADATASATPGGPTTALATTVPGQNAVLSFPGNANQSVTVVFSGGTYGTYDVTVVLRRPDGTTISSNTSCGVSCTFNSVLLPVTGTYTVLLDPEGTVTGTITVQVYDVPTDTTASTTPGGPAVGVTTTTPGQNAAITFPGTSGQRISVRLFNGSYGTYDATVTLRRPDGTSIATNTSCGASCFFDSTILPADGTYTVYVDPEGTVTGTISVQVYDVPADAAASTSPGGAAVSVATSTPGQNGVVSFPGTSGQRISVVMSAGTYGTYDATVSLRRPDGTSISSNTSCGASCFFDSTVLPADGTYTVFVDPEGTVTGGLTIRVYSVPADAVASTTAGGAAVSVNTPTPGQNGVVSFPGTSGQRISVVMSAGTYGTYDATVSLRRPDGTSVTSNTSCGASCFFDSTVLPADGTYTVFVDPEGTVTGGLTIRVYAVPADFSATAATDGTSVAVSTPTPGQNGVVSFAGTSGQRISVRFSAGTYGTYDATVTLRRPDGTSITSNTSCGASCFFEPTALTVTGTHTVLVDPEGTVTGGITVQVYAVPADASASTTPGGGATTVTTTVPGQNAGVTFPGNAGQVVTVNVTGVAFGGVNTAYTVRRPDGTSLSSKSTSGASTSFTNLTLPVAGSYTLYIDPSGIGVGSATVGITSTGLLAAAAPAKAGATGRTGKAATADKGGGNDEAAAERRDDTESWTPDRFNLNGEDWGAHRNPEHLNTLPPLRAAKGVTAISGQALLLNGNPLPGVTLRVGRHSVRTDATGRFLLTGIPAGHHVLVIDGGTASRPGRAFGRFETGVDVTEGETLALSYPIWMTRLDTANAVRFPSPTRRETVITTPAIPGFEVRLPAGAVIRDRAGKRVTELSITAIPVDRPPFPLPVGVRTPVYFTVQPGGAVVLPEGARIIYPNTQGLAPGSRLDFWDYDPERAPCVKAPVKSYPKKKPARPATAPKVCGVTSAEAGWYIYGQGTVSADGRQIIPDPGVRVWEFTGAMFNGSGMRAAGTGPGEDGDADGDPVDLGSGLFVESHTDLVVDDVIPISVTRTYRQNDTYSRAFGIGTNFEYGLFLQSNQQYVEADLVAPDSGKVHMVRTSAGTGWTDAVFKATGTTGPFRDAVMSWNGDGWDLVRTDGLVYVFGENAPLQAIRDRHGNQVTLTRSTGGQSGDIVQITSPNGRWIKFSYASGRITQARDNAGRTVQYGYDGQGRLTSVTTPGGKTTSYAYDSAHRMTTITDPRGITYLTNTYDSVGRVSHQSLPGGATYDFAYTVNGSGAITKTTVTDPEGGVSETSFDANRRMTSKTVAVGTALERTVSITRDTTRHLPTGLDDPYGRQTTLGYDAAGELTSVVTGAGTPGERTVTVTPGGPFGQIEALTDPAGKATTFEYDASGNLSSVTDAEGRTTGYTFNSAGQVTSSTDPLGNITTFGYDGGDLVSVTDPLGRTTRRFIDAVGRLVAMTDPHGVLNSVGYDADNNTVTSTDGLGQTTSYAYDGNGNLTSVTDARGNTTTFGYDTSDRVTSRTDPLGKTATQAYDKLGRIVASTDRRGSTTVTQYDALGRTTLLGYGATAGPTYQSTQTFGYDSHDRLTGITDSAGGSMTLGYDPLDQVTSVTTDAGSVSYSYDALGRRTGMAVSGQQPVSYDYDDTGLISSITQRSSVITWQRDGAGRTARIDSGGTKTTYQYDAASQLTGIRYATTADDLIGDLRYTHDRNGRIVGLAGSLADVTVPQTRPAVTIDAADRITRLGGTAFSYDDDGRLTGDGTRGYSWDARGQLAGVTGTGLTASYGYDAAGRRTSRTVNGATSTFRFDGANLVRETSAAGTVDRLVTGLDQTLARTDATGTQTPLVDALGSVVGLADADGDLVTSYAYEPFGAVSASGATSGNTQQFTGREYDDATGLLSNRARYYRPDLGRFISQDPADFGGGSTNLYTYALNDPVNLADPNGDCPICATLAAGCLIGGAMGALTGWGTSSLLGRKYSLGDGLRDFGGGCAAGALTSGLGALLGRGALSGTQLARQLGRQGEAASGLVKNTQRIVPPGAAPGKYRVPDGLDHANKVISEVKNVAQQSYTKQLRDYSNWAKANGYTFELHMRPGTKLSGPLQREIAAGNIIPRFLP